MSLGIYKQHTPKLMFSYSLVLKIQQHTYRMCQQSLLEVQGVTHTVALCLQVALVVLVGYHFDGHVLHNLESVRL